MLNSASAENLLVFPVEVEGWIEKVKATSRGTSSEKFDDLVVVLRKAVADHQDLLGLGKSFMGSVPDWSERGGWFLAANRRNNQSIATDCGAAIVVLNEFTTTLRPRNRAVQLQQGHGTTGNNSLDMGIAGIAASCQVRIPVPIVETGTRYTWSRPMSHSSLSEDVVVGRHDRDYPGPRKDRGPEILMHGDASAIEILFGHRQLSLETDLAKLAHTESDDQAGVPDSLTPGRTALCLKVGQIFLWRAFSLLVPSQPTSPD